jgi:hypothetical protein
VSATPTVTGTATPDATPTIVSLPTLAPDTDPIDAVVTERIGSAGGRIATADGRAVIDVPAGAFGEDLDVSITRLESAHPAPAHPDAQFIARWRFDAATVLSGTPVDEFGSPLTFHLRFSQSEYVVSHDPATMAFWTFDETIGRWTALESSVVEGDLHVVGLSDHFSEGAITANSLVSVAPLLDEKGVGLQTLSAEMSIPITVPPGRGGLAPLLAFTYSSNRTHGMRGYADHSSWAGLGWELDVPNIKVSWWGDEDDPPRAFLSLNGIGGEMMRGELDGSQYVWRLRNEQYVKIRGCDHFNCEFTVWDQSGTKYVFGSPITSPYKRYFRNEAGSKRIYRLDIRNIEDVLGNRIDFEYFQQEQEGPEGDEIMAAYPKRITYNGGSVEILFNGGDLENNGWEVSRDDPYDDGEHIRQRRDTPLNWTLSSCTANPVYVAPRIRETRKLTGIDVKVGGNLLRRYVPTFRTLTSTNGFDVACWFNMTAAEPPLIQHGQQLNSIAITDRSGASRASRRRRSSTTTETCSTTMTTSSFSITIGPFWTSRPTGSAVRSLTPTPISRKMTTSGGRAKSSPRPAAPSEPVSRR